MKLEAIKAEMREAAETKSSFGLDFDHGFRTAVNMYEQKLSELDPSEPLRRVRDKVKECCMANGFSHMRSLEFLDIIAALTEAKEIMEAE